MPVLNKQIIFLLHVLGHVIPSITQVLVSVYWEDNNTPQCWAPENLSTFNGAKLGTTSGSDCCNVYRFTYSSGVFKEATSGGGLCLSIDSVVIKPGDRLILRSDCGTFKFTRGEDGKVRVDGLSTYCISFKGTQVIVDRCSMVFDTVFFGACVQLPPNGGGGNIETTQKVQTSSQTSIARSTSIQNPVNSLSLLGNQLISSSHAQVSTEALRTASPATPLTTMQQAKHDGTIASASSILNVHGISSSNAAISTKWLSTLASFLDFQETRSGTSHSTAKLEKSLVLSRHHQTTSSTKSSALSTKRWAASSSEQIIVLSTRLINPSSFKLGSPFSSQITRVSFAQKMQVSASQLTQVSLAQQTQGSASQLTQLSLAQQMQGSASQLTQVSLAQQMQVSASQLTQESFAQQRRVSFSQIAQTSFAQEMQESLSRSSQSLPSQLTSFLFSAQAINAPPTLLILSTSSTRLLHSREIQQTQVSTTKQRVEVTNSLLTYTHSWIVAISSKLDSRSQVKVSTVPITKQEAKVTLDFDIVTSIPHTQALESSGSSPVQATSLRAASTRLTLDLEDKSLSSWIHLLFRQSSSDHKYYLPNESTKLPTDVAGIGSGKATTASSIAVSHSSRGVSFITLTHQGTERTASASHGKADTIFVTAHSDLGFHVAFKSHTLATAFSHFISNEQLRISNGLVVTSSCASTCNGGSPMTYKILPLDSGFGSGEKKMSGGKSIFYSIIQTTVSGAETGESSAVATVNASPLNGPWLPWSPCSVTCGRGTRERRRSCSDGSAICTNTIREQQPCLIKHCPGIFLASPGEQCSNFCQSRNLSCAPFVSTENGTQLFKENDVNCVDLAEEAWHLSYHPSFNAATNSCSGFVSVPEILQCSLDGIPKDVRRLCTCVDKGDEGYAPWSTWSPCSASCSAGIKTRTRRCLATSSCQGSSEQSSSCTIADCADMYIGQWRAWSSCSSTCGSGTRRRTRTCDAIATNSEFCDGYELWQQQLCQEQSCFVADFALPGQQCNTFCQTKGQLCSPILGSSNVVSLFSKASLNCTLRGTENITWSHSYHPSYDTITKSCIGYEQLPSSIECNLDEPIPSTIRRLCNCTGQAMIFTPAPVGQWSVWSPCSVTCGNGTRQRVRACLPGNQGSCNQSLTDVEWCQEERCSQLLLAGSNEQCSSFCWNRGYKCIMNETKFSPSYFELMEHPLDMQKASWMMSYQPALDVNVNKVQGYLQIPEVLLCHTQEVLPPWIRRICLCQEQSSSPLSTWSAWSSCSVSCGSGSRYRTKDCHVTTPGMKCIYQYDSCTGSTCSGLAMAVAGQQCTDYCRSRGLRCVSSFDQSSLLEDLTMLECKLSPTRNVWSEEYHPSLNQMHGTCEGYRMVPKRINCTTSRSFPSYIARLCNCQPEYELGFTTWTTWSGCTHSCGNGSQTRLRQCEQESELCQGSTVKTRRCNTQLCPDPTSRSWSTWSVCTKSCGGGTQGRSRLCPVDTHSGVCPLPTEDNQACNVHFCPVDALWTLWTRWSFCNKPCNGGVRQRWRSCNPEFPLYNGKPCGDEKVQTQPCNQRPCPAISANVTVYLKEEGWQNGTMDPKSRAFLNFESRFKGNLSHVYDWPLNSSIISSKLLELSQLKVIRATVWIRFKYLDSYQFVWLQDAIELYRQLHKLRILPGLYQYQLELVPSKAPGNFSGYALSNSSVKLSWLPVSAFSFSKTSLDSEGFVVFYRQELAVGDVYSRIGVQGLSVEVLGLRKFTSYIFRVLAFNRHGNGVASPQIRITTLGAAPTGPPSNLSIEQASKDGLTIQWQRVPREHMQGSPVGYRVKFASINDKAKTILNLDSGSGGSFITGLLPMTQYTIEVCAVTRSGEGPCSAVVGTTKASAPLRAPSLPRIKDGSAFDELVVAWEPISPSLVGGDLQGYNVSYTVSKFGNLPVTDQPTRWMLIAPGTTMAHLRGLQPNSEYHITVAAVNQHGSGLPSVPYFARTCRCPPTIATNFILMPPYTDLDNTGMVIGTFPEIIRRFVQVKCGLCHGKFQSSVSFQADVSNHGAIKQSLDQMLRSISENETQMSFPVAVNKFARRFADHPIAHVVEHPGVAYLRQGQTNDELIWNLLKTIPAVWPILFVVTLFIVTVGLLNALAQAIYNYDGNLRHFLKLWQDEMWWAFVTCTTLGYGDIVPKHFLGRLLTICWMLVGLVSISILVGAITSGFTVTVVRKKESLYGKEVGAVDGSYEYRIGVWRSAKVNPGTKYWSIEEVSSAFLSKKINGVLLDMYLTANRSTLFLDQESVVLSNVVYYPSMYGIVLSGSVSFLEDEINDFVKASWHAIARRTQLYGGVLQVSKSQRLVLSLSFSSSLYIALLTILSVSLAVAFVLGLAHQHRKRGLRSNKVRSEHAISCSDEMLDSYEMELLVEEFYTGLNRRANDLITKHAEERLALYTVKKTRWNAWLFFIRKFCAQLFDSQQENRFLDASPPTSNCSSPHSMRSDITEISQQYLCYVSHSRRHSTNLRPPELYNLRAFNIEITD